MEWFKWFGGASNDPKFHVVARKTNQPMGFVVAVWAMLLERASEAEDRGSIAGFDCEAADVIMGMPDGAACAIVEAMQAKGLIDGDRIYKWEERQAPADRPVKSTSTQRVQRFRERQRAGMEKDETPGETDETPRNTDVTDETRGNVSSRIETDETPGETDETHETDKEEIREDKNLNTSPPIDIFKYKDARVAKTVPDGEGGDGEVPAPPDENFDFGFAQTWEAYPAERRGPVADAVIAWKGLARARDLPGLPILLEAVTKWEASGQWQRENGRFIPHFANFLRRRMWEQDPPPDKAGAARPKSARDEQAETMDRWAREMLEEERRQKEAEAV